MWGLHAKGGGCGWMYTYLQSPHIEFRSGHSACKLCRFFFSFWVMLVLYRFYISLRLGWISYTNPEWNSRRHAEPVREYRYQKYISIIQHNTLWITLIDNRNFQFYFYFFFSAYIKTYKHECWRTDMPELKAHLYLNQTGIKRFRNCVNFRYV